MPPEQREDKSQPRNVGHVDVEVVGVDDVSRGADPTLPPANDTSRIIAMLSYLLIPVAVWALAVAPYRDEQFVRAHALQAVALWALVALLIVIPFVTNVLAFAGMGVAIFAARRAWEGEYLLLPGIWQLVRRFM